MSLNTYFDKIFCINLDRRPDRWADCLEQIKLYNLQDVERFPAFDYPEDGNFGCTRTHRVLLRKIAEGPWKRVLVLEDDFHVLTLRDLKEAGFVPGSQVWETFISAPVQSLSARFDTMVQYVPDDWDILYLGGGYAGPPIARVHKHVVRCGRMFTTGSYGVTRKFAGVWSDAVDASTKAEADTRGIHPYDVGIGSIDGVFCEYFATNLTNKFYIFQPRLMIQRKSKSDLNGQTNSYLFSMTDPVHENMV
jgi:hypothetical protein